MRMLVGTTALVMAVSSAMPTPAWPALGQTAETVERDRVIMKGQRQSRSDGVGYSIDTITVAGMEIKEYVSPNGVVFAVAWKGTGIPNLQVLLGEYYEEYRAGVRAARNRTPRVREPFRMKSNRLVVERAGHSRSLWGRAYLPARVPPGAKLEDLQ